MLQRLKDLQAKRGAYPNGDALFEALQDDIQLRREVEALSEFFLGHTVSGCRNCYVDAFFELLNYPIEKAMERAECKYHLLAGVLLQDVVNYDRSKMCTNANLTNELAEYHLRTNPDCRQYFDRLPDDAPQAESQSETKSQSEAVEDKAAAKTTQAKSKRGRKPKK